MDLNSKNSVSISKNFDSLIYSLICTFILICVARFVDLPFLFGNWEIKSKSILNFNLNDNFYPPGAALALIPFLWAGPTFSLGVFFYYFLASFTYHKLCKLVVDTKFRKVALIALPVNPYLSWLCITSADQVIELLFLLLFVFLAIQKKYIYCIIFGWALCLTRPAYWIAFILITMTLKTKCIQHKSQRTLVRYGGLITLAITLTGNTIVFSSPNLSSSSGLTFLYSHNEYHYLSLPKFDMDVFLNNQMNPKKIIGNSDEFSFIEDEYLRAGVISIKRQPKQFIISNLQKINSYFFSVEKVPNLPGQYYLSQDAKKIIIENERLTWVIVGGNTTYLFYKIIWMILFSITFSYFVLKKIQRQKLGNKEIILLLPYLCGIVPGLLFYVETRFKICTELLLVPLMVAILSKFVKLKVIEDTNNQ